MTKLINHLFNKHWFSTLGSRKAAQHENRIGARKLQLSEEVGLPLPERDGKLGSFRGWMWGVRGGRKEYDHCVTVALCTWEQEKWTFENVEQSQKVWLSQILVHTSIIGKLSCKSVKGARICEWTISLYYNKCFVRGSSVCETSSEMWWEVMAACLPQHGWSVILERVYIGLETVRIESIVQC